MNGVATCECSAQFEGNFCESKERKISVSANKQYKVMLILSLIVEKDDYIKQETLLYLQIKYVFRLEEDVSRVVGQNSPSPYVIKACTLKLRQIYEPASVKQTISSQFFYELGGITKQLTTDPA